MTPFVYWSDPLWTVLSAHRYPPLRNFEERYWQRLVKVLEQLTNLTCTLFIDSAQRQVQLIQTLHLKNRIDVLSETNISPGIEDLITPVLLLGAESIQQ